jgi:hypothetical protein
MFYKNAGFEKDFLLFAANSKSRGSVSFMLEHNT